jgi:hypothetical protein
MVNTSKPVKPVFTRSFFVTRIVFYVVVAFLVREGVNPPHGTHNRALLSSDFTAWSATFPSRLDRAMATADAE